MHAIPQESDYGTRVGPVEFIWAKNSQEFFFSNSILILDPKLTIVDPSANFSYLEQLAAQRRVKQVLNTHYHVDHRSLNSMFREASFICHELDHPSLISFENYLQYADQERDSEYVRWLKGIFSSLEINKRYFNVLLKDGDYLPLDERKVKVVHLPGHTPGHIGLFFEEIDLLYTSDIDLTPHGPWYANISSNIEDFLASIEKLKRFHCRYYVTSHGSRVYDEEKFREKLERFSSLFYKRDERILEELKLGPIALESLAKIGIIFKKSHLDKDPLKASFERQMIEKHLERFAEQGRTFKDQGLWHLC